MLKKNCKIKGFWSFMLTAILVLCTNTAFAANEAMLDLLKVLRDKGTLTNQEYDLLINASRADEEQQSATASSMEQKLDTAIEEVHVSGKTSSWADKVKLKGDIRTRYQGQWEDGTEDRHRGRVRYRLGVIAKPLDQLEVGAGLASGSDDLRSTNQSFDNTFSTKAINLDYAYAQYEFNDNIKAIAGKLLYKSYLYTVTDLLWDSDINPEGISFNYTGNNSAGTLFANAGIWVLEENSGSDDDPYMVYAQLGQKFNIGAASAALAGTYYSFNEINALGDIVTDGTNTDYQFENFSLAGELSFKDVVTKGTKVSLFADWVTNLDTNSDEDTGFAVGLKAEHGRWGFKYIYADLDANAWPDILPDSDRFDGLTGIDGHEFILEYDIMDNVTLGLDYYLMENDANIEQNLLQLDVVVKF